MYLNGAQKQSLWTFRIFLFFFLFGGGGKGGGVSGGAGGVVFLLKIEGGGWLFEEEEAGGWGGKRLGDVCGEGGGGINIFFGAEIPTKQCFPPQKKCLQVTLQGALQVRLQTHLQVTN